jgi:hypothetical protein
MKPAGVLLLGAARPEHSLCNAIFWLLVVLAVLIAAMALKVFFGIVDRETDRWIKRRSSRTATRKNRQDAKPAKEENV